VPDRDDGDMTANWPERPPPLTLDDYLALDEEKRRDYEVVEGNLALPRGAQPGGAEVPVSPWGPT